MSSTPQPNSSHLTPRLLVVACLFITCLITANIAAVKLVDLAGLVVPAGVIIFPISYILGDVLTEVYGYAQARRVIWLGFLCNLLAVTAFFVAQSLPAAPVWDAQAAFERILGSSPRLLAASFTAFLLGSFANAFVMAKMKMWCGGRWLWARTIASTFAGEGLDSLAFISLAFLGSVPQSTLAGMILSQWGIKVAYESAATPLTYLVVNALKRAEGLDVYDRQTDFNPLNLSSR